MPAIFSLNSNGAATSAQYRLSRSTAELNESFSRLSSGLRINRAVDDAAGLAIASALNVDSRVYSAATRNLNDTVSALSLYESAFVESQSIVTRMQELASQASNGVMSTSQRTALHLEAKALSKEYSRILNDLSFNGRNLLGDSAGNIQAQAGYGAASSVIGNLGNEVMAEAPNGTFLDPLTVSSLTTSMIAHLANGRDGYVTNTGTSLVVRSSNGDGTFTASQTIAVTAGVGNDFQLGDINGDGLTDIFYAYVDAGAEVNLLTYIAQANGSFISGGNDKHGADASVDGLNVWVGDFTGDGVIDALVGLDHSSNSLIWSVTSSGNVNQENVIVFSTSGPTDIADANGDGLADLLNSTSVQVRIAGSSGFSTTATGLGPQAQYDDINGDGFIDAVGIVSGSLKYFLGNGNGTFRAGVTFLTGGGTAFDLRDVNDDGAPDILARAAGNAKVLVYLNDGEGTFTFTQTVNATSTSAIGDFNGDGALDFFSGANYFQGVVTPQVQSVRVDLRTQASAREALDSLEEASERISAEIGSVGSLLSRISSALNTVQTNSVEFRESASRISDVDVAFEAASSVRKRIVQQSATAILSQANQQPGIALSLLKAPTRPE